VNPRRTKCLLVRAVPLLVGALGLAAFITAVPRIGYCFDTEFDEAGERLFLTAGSRGLHVFEASPEGSIKLLTTYFDGGYYRYVEVVGDTAYVANSAKGLEILDIRGDVPEPVWAQAGSKGYGLHVQGQLV
jgi:hypothetical protein